MSHRLIIIAGPTASGKSRMAMELAEKSNSEILNCDALQVYKGMDIGTAKASKAEQERVRHHGIDIISIKETFDIAQYLEMATAAVKSIHSRGKQVVVVGGSGLYLKSFFAPVLDAVHVPQTVSEKVAEMEKSGGNEALVTALLGLDKHAAEALDIKNPRRVYRALERCLASGKSVAQLKDEYSARKSAFEDYSKTLHVLMPDPDDLRKKITERTKMMLENGLVDEVKELLEKGLAANRTAKQAIGYAQTIEYLKGGGSLEDLEEAINHASFKYARRQRTWLRHQLPEADCLIQP